MNRIISCILALCLIGTLVGCSNTTKHSPNDNYNMEYGTDANAYCNFVNKQLITVVNQISAHMITSMKATEVTAKSFAESVKHSLTTVQEAKHQVDIMRPASGYESKRENTLHIMQQSVDILDNLLSILETKPLNEAELDKIGEKMQANFIELTAEFGLYYK